MNGRLEYEVARRLVWDAELRRSFLAAPHATLRREFPSLTGLDRFGPQQFAGVEEESYRRMSELCREARALFPHGFPLLAAHGGEPFFEKVLSNYLPLPESDLVTEAFAPARLGPRLLQAARAFSDGELSFVETVVAYEWARYRARESIRDHDDPDASDGPLVAGASLIFAPFDLPGLLRDIHRIAAGGGPPWLVRRRARPAPGSFRCAIFPRARSVVEAALSPSLYDALMSALRTPGATLPVGLREELRGAGLLREGAL